MNNIERPIEICGFESNKTVIYKKIPGQKGLRVKLDLLTCHKNQSIPSGRSKVIILKINSVSWLLLEDQILLLEHHCKVFWKKRNNHRCKYRAFPLIIIFVHCHLQMTFYFWPEPRDRLLSERFGFIFGKVELKLLFMTLVKNDCPK